MTRHEEIVRLIELNLQGIELFIKEIVLRIEKIRELQEELKP